jgi:hypothetical protein
MRGLLDKSWTDETAQQLATLGHVTTRLLSFQSKSRCDSVCSVVALSVCFKSCSCLIFKTLKCKNMSEFSGRMLEKPNSWRA